MKLTKHKHACLELELAGQLLIIDPGNYTDLLKERTNVAAVVITHNHDDHCDEAQLDALAQQSPALPVFATEEVCARLRVSRPHLRVTPVHHGDHVTAGPFTLEFFGDLHQVIHRSIPLIQNCGVMVNDSLYYPGDSYTLPDRSVRVLACPASAPWLKIGDVIDFIHEVKPERCFATHNIHLSEIGLSLTHSRMRQATEQVGGTFEVLGVGDATEL